MIYWTLLNWLNVSFYEKGRYSTKNICMYLGLVWMKPFLRAKLSFQLDVKVFTFKELTVSNVNSHILQLPCVYNQYN